MDQMPSSGDEVTDYGIKTYRYLRIAMASLVVCLLASVVYEYWENPKSCWQGSLSAYYYTPARPIFVAALLAIGMSMVALLGHPRLHDLVLNVGGFAAIVVALVPTPNKGTCMSVPFQSEERAANISNNMTAFFVGAVIAMIVTVLTARSEGKPVTPTEVDTTLPLPVVIVIETFLLVGTAVWFFWLRDSFDQRAHWTAAVLLCASIILLVVLNARGAWRQGKKKYSAIYFILAIGIVGNTAVMSIIKYATGWGHATLGIEVVLIALFGVFWGIQTKDLWRYQVRPSTDADAQRAST